MGNSALIFLSGILMGLLDKSSGQVYITAVNPTIGSLAGGTRMVIRGSGFSTSTSSVGNVVLIGEKYRCDPIPLHCTVNQIICKTRSALQGYYSTSQDLWTLPQNITIVVDGVQSSVCMAASGQKCTFQFSTSWYYTPSIQNLKPLAVSSGDMLTVTGNFFSGPFAFSQLQAPTLEVPLASVKVVNRNPEEQRPENEPFGPSGTRCALFDSASEVPYGILPDDGGSLVSRFLCQISGPREVGRYNLSVALLGEAMSPDSKMNMGESRVAATAYLVDHHGTSFMLQHVGRVSDYWPKGVGVSGGALVTIVGDGFPNAVEGLEVDVSGTLCTLLMSSLNKMVCEMAAYSPNPNKLFPGQRGILVRMWFNAWESMKSGASLTNFMSSPLFLNNLWNSTWSEQSLFEAPVNVQSSMGHSSGPFAQFLAFFRPPVTSNYTFIVAADDFAMVWLGKDFFSMASMERIINSPDWVGNREWCIDVLNPRMDLGWWRSNDIMNTGRDPITVLQTIAQRKSRQVRMVAGEYYAMQAAYISGMGGDNFAVAAVIHESPVNRKDSPAAVDEKQLISLDFVSNMEVHNISLAPVDSSSSAQLGGTFKLSIGGKQSRPIPADASSGSVAAAIRELFSNCNGDNGNEGDAAGSTFDCWQGTGVEYRGLAATTLSGKPCQDWSKTPIWHPSLAITVGLEKNLCRNPNNDRSRGLWCYNLQMQPESCAVPRCGGDQMISLVSTFEDEEDLGLARTNTWDVDFGVIPRVTHDEAFCGRSSLFLSNSFSLPRMQWRRQRTDRSDANEMLVYSTTDYPFICMAYKIPPTSEVSMQLGFAWPGQTWSSTWRTLSMTNSKVSSWAPLLQQFDIIKDGQWHYTCLNVNASLGPTDPNRVVDVRFFVEGQPSSSFVQNPFWIDEFSISKTYRSVTQSFYPDLGGVVPRLVSVSRTQTMSGFVWSITLTSENCSVPAVDFDLDTSGIIGDLGSASVARIQEHSEPLVGDLLISFQGASTSFSPYSSAGVIKSKFEELSTVNGVNIRRAGVCQTGFSFLVTFTHNPGDLPPIQVTLLLSNRANNTVSVIVETINNGGLFMAPISAEYFHLPSNTSTLNIWSDKSAFWCSTNTSNVSSSCGFSISESQTPAILSADYLNFPGVSGDFGLTTFSLYGSGFLSQVSNSTSNVMISNVSCAVSYNSNSNIVCRLSEALSAGHHRVLVRVPDKGWARGNISVMVPLRVDSVSPSSFNMNWPTVLIITGLGFSSADISSNLIIFDFKDASSSYLGCTPLNSSVSKLFCLTDPSQLLNGTTDQLYSSRRKRSFSTETSVILRLYASVGSANTTLENAVLMVNREPPVVRNIFPSEGSAGGFTAVTILGTSFSDSNDTVVLIGSSICPVSFVNSTTVICTFQPYPPGLYNVTVSVLNAGFSYQCQNSRFLVSLNIAMVEPKVVSIFGGLTVTAHGSGFVTSMGSVSDVSVIVPGWTVYVVGLYSGPQVTDIHDIMLNTQYTNEVQRLTLSGSFVQWFRVRFLERISENLPRSVNQFALQVTLSSLLPSGSVRVVRTDRTNGTVEFRFEFLGKLGDIPLLEVTACNRTFFGYESDCQAGVGVEVTEIVRGRAPQGYFELKLNGFVESVPISVNSSADELKIGLSRFPIAGGVEVERADVSTGLRWRVIFGKIQEEKRFFVVNSSKVFGGTVSAVRVRDGSVAPKGSWRLGLGDMFTRSLPLNASEKMVLSALREKFSLWDDVVDAHVHTADNYPGPILNRFYPRQWVIRLKRKTSAGLGQDRCTRPLFIDWDPSACPRTAADLFLSYHPYFWPVGLPKPENLGEPAQQDSLQQACDRESLLLNLIPSICGALKPQETLPYCGVGSGRTPPCWVTRFSEAKVVLGNGEEVIFFLDTSKAPSDNSKGYLYWKRADLEAAMHRKTLILNSSIDDLNLGMELNLQQSVSANVIRCDVTFWNYDTILFKMPSLGQQIPSYLQYLLADMFYSPLLFWRIDGIQSLNSTVLMKNVETSAAMMHSGNAALFSFSEQKKIPFVEISFSPVGFSSFTLDFWFRFDAASSLSTSNCSSVLRVMCDDVACLTIVVCRRCTQTARVGVVIRVGQSSEVPLITLEGTVLDIGTWTHLAVAVDSGGVLFFQDGVQTDFLHLISPLDWNPVNPRLLLGGSCDSSLSCPNPSFLCSDQSCETWRSKTMSPFNGALDWVLWYPVWLTPGCIAGHAAFQSLLENLFLEANYGAIRSTCTQCEISASFPATPNIISIYPSRSAPGETLTISGAFPNLDSTTADNWLEARFGEAPCIVIEATAVRVVCNLSIAAESGIAPLTVTVRGAGSSEPFAFEIAPLVLSVHPRQGTSVLGGGIITIDGRGFPAQGAVVTVGGGICDIHKLTPDRIVCQVALRTIPTAPYLSVPVRVTAAGVKSLNKCAVAPSEVVCPSAPRDGDGIWYDWWWTCWKSTNESHANKTSSANCWSNSSFGELSALIFDNAGGDPIESWATFDVQPLSSAAPSYGDCNLCLSAGWTPALLDVSPRVVEEGFIMVILGRRLPIWEGLPLITIGRAGCEVLEHNSTRIICRVGSGEAGTHRFTVHYEMSGYAIDLSVRNSLEPRIFYRVRVNTVFPSVGSAWGGGVVTVSGSGFSPLIRGNTVFLGSLACLVVNATHQHLLVHIPPIDASWQTNLGFERVAMEGSILASAAAAAAGASNVSSETRLPIFPFNPLSVLFRSGTGSAVVIEPLLASQNTSFLVDGISDTVWRSGQWADMVWIGIDLLRTQNISTVRLEWAGMYFAARVNVWLVGENEGPAVASRSRVLCWPYGPGPNLVRACGNGSQSCQANQSSTLNGNTASRAVDGSRAQNLSAGSCASTTSQSQPWWRVDLGGSRNVRGGLIWNRADSNPERLDGFRVYVGDGNGGWADALNILCYTAAAAREEHQFYPWTHSFDCVGRGRYLYIMLPSSQPLSLCEVEVYGETDGCAVLAPDVADVYQFKGVMARFVVLQLVDRPEGMMSEFRIRNVRVLGENEISSASLEVRVNGQLASCTYALTSRPVVFGVSPVAGNLGTIVRVNGTGFNVSDCSRYLVAAGLSSWKVTSCTQSALLCLLTENHAAGIYTLRVSIRGVGRALCTAVFNYTAALTAVSPEVVGLGGGALVTIEGLGIGMGAVAQMCGSLCNAAATDANGTLLFELPKLVEPPMGSIGGQAALPSNGLVVMDLAAAEDALEFATAWCLSYSVSGSIRTCICEAEAWLCYRTRYADVRSTVAATEAATLDHFRRSGLALNRTWGCDCTGPSGVVVHDAARVGFDQVVGGSAFAQGSPQVVYFRFENVSAPRNVSIADARLLIYAASSSCVAGSTIRIWAEAAGDSKRLRGSAPGTMQARPRTGSFVDWTLVEGWRWPYGQEQSVDISPVIREVVADARWRSGGAITLVLRQTASGGGPCVMLSSESGANYSPILRLSLSISSRAVVDLSISMTFPCAIDISVSPLLEAPVYFQANSCDGNLAAAIADFQTPSQTDKPIPPGLVSTSAPCCLSTGKLIDYAVDGWLETWWASPDNRPINVTLDLGPGGAVAKKLRLEWTDGFAARYRVLVSTDGAKWVTAAREDGGDGRGDLVTLNSELDMKGALDMIFGSNLERRVRYLRIWIEAPGTAVQKNYGIREIFVKGCGQPLAPAPAAPSSSASALPTAPAVQVSRTITASRNVTALVMGLSPTMGSTAGGTLILLSMGLPSLAVPHIDGGNSSLILDFGGFPCEVVSVQRDFSISVSISGNGISWWRATCRTGRSGPASGGLKYIDAWSARTTWGGDLPPVGCGDYVVDRECTDSVVIPEGQTVLLDVSPPRLYLLLIEGTLIFDRRDLQLKASYILVRGGTLQVGTESEPFLHRATFTLYGHPQSLELPTFGSKVLACYACHLDLHGAPGVSWTELAATAWPGDRRLRLMEAVAWAPGSKVVVATTDFESAFSSHSEVLTVEALEDDGRTLVIRDATNCATATFSGTPTDCTTSAGLAWPHVGETRLLDGREVAFRAEVALLTRNLVLEGDADEILCPVLQYADDGATKRSCNQFGGQIFLHSPGPDSLVARLSNLEVRNGGQAFRLGRYSIHWHMIGDVRASFQRNCSIHHSWNRGTAFHGINYLRAENNFVYSVMGHAFFIEDGVEQNNLLRRNLGIRVQPSMSLLNTDQTPAVFWVTNAYNSLVDNHAAGSLRYGFWYRPELAPAGTSTNTPIVPPINIPILLSSGNVAHSNGKYGLRVYDVYQPNKPSVFRNFLLWRNGAAAWTGTVIGQVGFDGFIAVNNGASIFEGRATTVSSWDNTFIRGGLFADNVGLPLGRSFAVTSDEFDDANEMGGPQLEGLLLPWNENAGGGMLIVNVTFINFANPCIRGCAHCGRGGSPVLGDGAFETRFRNIRFVNSSKRVYFRHPNEAFLYDLDGTLTGSGIVESYTRGGAVRGSSFVGSGPLLPPAACQPSPLASGAGTGGSVCNGVIFRRFWFHIRNPSAWIGKALCVRVPWRKLVDRCQSLEARCDCLPYLKKQWMGNVFLAAEGYRYNLQMDLETFDLADPITWNVKVWDAQPGEKFRFSHRLLQWQSADRWLRPLYNLDAGVGQTYAQNQIYNRSACTYVGCGQLIARLGYMPLEDDVQGNYTLGEGGPGMLPVPSSGHRSWTVLQDSDGSGAVLTFLMQGSSSASHLDVTSTIRQCPLAGCWPPPPPPPVVVESSFGRWSDPATWNGTLDSLANPMNVIQADPLPKGGFTYRLLTGQRWRGMIPGDGDDVWIPSWKKVLLDTSTGVLGRVVVEGSLIINTTVNLTAVYLEIRGGRLVIAELDSDGGIVGSFQGRCVITLLGTNPRLAALNGPDPRENPVLVLGREGVKLASGILGVFGEFIALGRATSSAWAALAQPVTAGDQTVFVEGIIDWAIGSEVVVSPTDYDPHEGEVRTIVGIGRADSSDGEPTTAISLNNPLQFQHFAGGWQSYGTRKIRIRGEVGLLSRDIVIRGEGQGEDVAYTAWNAPAAAALVGGPRCGNRVCEPSENSITCPSECRGPVYEYGAGVLVGTYSDDSVFCGQDGTCSTGYRRSFRGMLNASGVELRYFGQSGLREGLTLLNLGEGGKLCEAVGWSFNRGYFGAVSLQGTSHAAVRDGVIYRGKLPLIRVEAGNQGFEATDNLVKGMLAVVGIFWSTHRGAKQGMGMSKSKLEAMMGMFHDGGSKSRFVSNVAAGSERAGFSGPGMACPNAPSFSSAMEEFDSNVVHSALSGFWFDYYVFLKGDVSCVSLRDFTCWKLWLYGVYGEFTSVNRVSMSGLAIADSRAGVRVSMVGGGLLPKVVSLQRSIIVGRSSNSNCLGKIPSLWTCAHAWAYCSHLNPEVTQVGVAALHLSVFPLNPGMAPIIHPWNDMSSYPGVHGQTDISDVTFAAYGATPCLANPGAVAAAVGLKGILRDVVLSGQATSAVAADAWHPASLERIELVGVDAESLVRLQPASPTWLNQADCIDMDCDGPRHTLIRDEDGTLLGGSGGTILSRADVFSSNSFFGIPYADPVNRPAEAFWYPNLPVAMRSDRSGALVNVTQTWISSGFGISRSGCTLQPSWNGWQCLNNDVGVTSSYRMVVIESLDADAETRRISPVAIASDDGYVDLMNGCMDHGWCFSYTCLKRLMSFWSVLAMGRTYTVFFTGSPPQSFRLTLLRGMSSERTVMRFFFSGALRLQVFVGGVFFEDLNMHSGQAKAQLVREGRWAPNGPSSTYLNQGVSPVCGCILDGICVAADVVSSAGKCDLASNVHGANSFDKTIGMLSVVVGGHDPQSFIEIRAMPVVQVSMSLSVSAQNFYLVKDTFISNLASVLGINPRRITIVDVVSGRRRARSLLQSGGGTSVSMEIAPDPVIGFAVSEIVSLDNVGVLNISVSRTVNVLGNCSVQFSTAVDETTSGKGGIDFQNSSVQIFFASGQVSAVVSVAVFSAPYYRETAATFFVRLSSVVSASLGASSSLVTLQGVHPPAPVPPIEVASTATVTTIQVQWSRPQWPQAPSSDLAEPVLWEVSCNWSNSEFNLSGSSLLSFSPSAASTSATSAGLTSAGTAVFGGLSARTGVICRVRLKTSQGWTRWSGDSIKIWTLAVCGDGYRQGSEQCDDGNVNSNDGCSIGCSVETNFSCVRANQASPDVCSSGCGDGVVVASENCDDGNLNDGDGCSAACRTEVGWNCTTGQSSSVCVTFCGDGVLVASREQCDDMGTAAGDGCAKNCTIEPGWSCTNFPGGLSSCRRCGDGILQMGEVCDDALVSGGCNTTCTGVLLGWSCASTGSGSLCTAGPSAPGRPSVSVADGTLTSQWSAADGYGLPISTYSWQLAVGWANGSYSWNAVTSRSGNISLNTLSLRNLTAGTVFLIRVSACNRVGCGPFGPTSAPVRTPDAPAQDLQNIGSNLQAGMQGLGFNVTNMTVAQPPDAPSAPSNSGGGIVNLSALMDQLGLNNASQTDNSFVLSQPVVDTGSTEYPSSVPMIAFDGNLSLSLPALIPSRGCAEIASGRRFGSSAASAVCAIIDDSRSGKGFFMPGNCQDTVVSTLYNARGDLSSTNLAANAPACSAVIYNLGCLPGGDMRNISTTLYGRCLDACLDWQTRCFGRSVAEAARFCSLGASLAGPATVGPAVQDMMCVCPARVMCIHCVFVLHASCKAPIFG